MQRVAHIMPRMEWNARRGGDTRGADASSNAPGALAEKIGRQTTDCHVCDARCQVAAPRCHVLLIPKDNVVALELQA